MLLQSINNNQKEWNVCLFRLPMYKMHVNLILFCIFFSLFFTGIFAVCLGKFCSSFYVFSKEIQTHSFHLFFFFFDDFRANFIVEKPVYYPSSVLFSCFMWVLWNAVLLFFHPSSYVMFSLLLLWILINVVEWFFVVVVLFIFNFSAETLFTKW